MSPARASKPLVVLWDVDETLVHTGGAGARSWDDAFRKLYDVPADIGQHSSAGETDPEVGLATFKGVLGRDATHEEINRVYAQYLVHLAENIWTSERYRVLPGAEQVLGDLSDAGVMLGIVSGAMEGAARTKLTRANLNRFFIFGGYGSDSPVRAELVTAAIDRAARLHDRLDPSQVTVVGDTPRDIESARAVGAVSVGVASGHFSVEELAAAGADHVLGSLEDAFPGL